MYSWLWLALVSGVLLGAYDICTKKALIKTPLFNVLAYYTMFCLILVSFEFRNAVNADIGSIFLIFLKSVVVLFAWLFSFIAIRGLPISIIVPFNVITPIFTILLGVLVLNEKLVYLQAVGILVIMISYYFIGMIGKVEVKDLFKNKYLYLMIASTLFSAFSALMDKFILKKVNAGQMQFWFSLFIFLMFAAILVINKINDREVQLFKFNYFVILMSVFLILSDRLYFSAVKMPVSEISIIMPLRRVSIVVSTIAGGLVFKEKNLKKKFICVCFLILGIALVFAGK